MSTWQDVIDRANSDPQFRGKLKSNPAAACKEAGVSVPPGATVKVVERQPAEIYLILNPVGSGELDDALLESVAGGTDSYKLLATVSHNQAESAADDLEGIATTPTGPTRPTTPKPPRTPTKPQRPQ